MKERRHSSPLDGSSVLLPDLTHHGTGRFRQIWVLFVVPVLVLVVVAAVWSPQTSSGNAGLFTAVAGAVAVIDFGSVFWIRHVGTAAILQAESNAEIRDAYLRRMILACAFATVPPILAFSFAVLVGTTTVFYVIAAVSLVLLVVAGPRNGDITRLDDRMVDAGRPFRVAAALDV